MFAGIRNNRQGKTKTLSDVKVAKLKHSGGDAIEKHPDRDGLYLAVSRPHKDDKQATYGSKAWRYEYRWPPTTMGKRQTLTYGKYPELSLADARERHLEQRSRTGCSQSRDFCDELHTLVESVPGIRPFAKRQAADK